MSAVLAGSHPQSQKTSRGFKWYKSLLWQLAQSLSTLALHLVHLLKHWHEELQADPSLPVGNRLVKARLS